LDHPDLTLTIAALHECEFGNCNELSVQGSTNTFASPTTGCGSEPVGYHCFLIIFGLLLIATQRARENRGTLSSLKEMKPGL